MPERLLLRNSLERRHADEQFRKDLYNILERFDRRLERLERRWLIAATVSGTSGTIFGFVIGLVLEGKLIIHL